MYTCICMGVGRYCYHVIWSPPGAGRPNATTTSTTTTTTTNNTNTDNDHQFVTNGIIIT